MVIFYIIYTFLFGYNILEVRLSTMFYPNLCYNEPRYKEITSLLTHSADDKFVIFWLFFPYNRFWHFTQIVSTGDNLHEIPKSCFLRKIRNDIFLIFSRKKKALTVHAKCLHWRQFAWNAKSCLLEKIRNKSCPRTASSPAGYILYCNIFIVKPYNIGHTDLDVFVCKSFCLIDIIIQVWQFSMK